MIDLAMKSTEYFRRNLHKNRKAMEHLGHPTRDSSAGRISTSSQSSTARSTTTRDSPSGTRSINARRSNRS